MSKSSAFQFLSVLIGVATAFVISEAFARWLESRVAGEGRVEFVRHDVLGWLPAPGRATETTREFVAHYDVNSLGMNDKDVDGSVTKAGTRILALGDSHTFAVGVSQEEAWPNVLEAYLFKNNVNSGTVYNAGVVGYSLGQYLLLMRKLEDVLNPQIILIGFSMATDLYDLTPPRLGGFVYGQPWGRVYFDLERDGSLAEIHDLEGVVDITANHRGSQSVKRTLATRLKDVLGHLALYRQFKRSRLAMWLAVHFHIAGESLWPGLDTALKIDLDENDRYRWELAERLLEQIAGEAKRNGREVVLVNIPYLAQAYDEVWNVSFGALPDRYDRWIGGKRLEHICQEAGIHYVDSTPVFVEEARKRDAWLHYKKDGHPTVEGQRIIARTVADYLTARMLVR
jgi:lysophospholipase L1-like esterase